MLQEGMLGCEFWHVNVPHLPANIIVADFETSGSLKMLEKFEVFCCRQQSVTLSRRIWYAYSIVDGFAVDI